MREYIEKNLKKMQKTRINPEKLAKLHTVEELLTAEYGERGTLSREEFDAKSREWYSQLS